MAFSLEQYQALSAAVAEGALSVRYADKSVTYRSLDEMLRLLKLMATELGITVGAPGGRRYTSFSKGF